ncbi:protoporphyrinogen oxidase [Gordoniibacillus kamchatkensis]|uniref:protoporphyrinogen oxidase n=1 Tax=Gordoniibacillus kamchatkensis TaxID=1590651 RepID=UPI000A9528D7
MSTDRKKIVVIGGGISGLSAAFYLGKLLHARQIDADMTIVEKSNALGGKIKTLIRDGYIIEQGPDSFISRKPSVLELSKELGLEDELVGTNPKARTNYIMRKGKLHQMPLGLVLGVPTDLASFAWTGLVSPLGKARAAMDLLMPGTTSSGDESLGHFIRRRLGREMLEQVTEPLLAGIYAGDTSSLSLQATFPQFRELERKYGSLIKGLLAERKSNPAPKDKKSSLFMTFKGGLAHLVDRLSDKLRTSMQIWTGNEAVSIDRNEKGYKVAFNDGKVLSADGIVLAIPAFAAAQLLAHEHYTQWLNRISYVSVANASLVFDRQDVSRELNGSGFVVPSKEGYFITACTWTSSKWLHTAPEGSALLRVYIGRSGNEQWQQMSDEQLKERILFEIREIMGISGKPRICEIARLPQSMPQYPVGHMEQMRKLKQELNDRMPGVLFVRFGLRRRRHPGLYPARKTGGRAAGGFFATAVTI